MLQVASGLLVIYQTVDGGIGPADGARVTMTDWHRAELHGLGIKRQQTVRQQFTLLPEWCPACRQWHPARLPVNR